MDMFKPKPLAIASCFALLAACCLAPEASAQNKRYSIPKQPTARLQPAKPQYIAPPQTRLKPAVQGNIRVAPPATRFATPATQPVRGGGFLSNNGAGVIGQNGASVIGQNGANIVTNNGSRFRR